jgi:hypothetical protein
VIGVVHELVARLASSERHHERGDDQVGGLTFTHRPADEGVVAEIADAGEVELPVDAVKLADVSNPSQIRTWSSEVAFEQVRCRDHPVVGTPPLPAGVRP